MTERGDQYADGPMSADSTPFWPGADGEASILRFKSPEFRDDPYSALARLRATHPVHRHPMGMWLLTRHAEVLQVLRDPRLGHDLQDWEHGEELRPFFAESALERCVEAWMLSLQEPELASLGAIVGHAFAPSAAEAMRPLVQDIARDITASCNAGEMDFRISIANPLPVRVIAAALGLAETAVAELMAMARSVGRKLEPFAPDAAMTDSVRQLRRQFADRLSCVGADATDHIPSVFTEAFRSGTDRGSLLADLVILFLAGAESTSNLLVNGMLALARHPEQIKLLNRKICSTSHAVEELLRYAPPTDVIARVAQSEIEIGGTFVIKPGELVLSMIGAANRDPEMFAQPDELDLGRDPNPHVTFGPGIHACSGSTFARLEIGVTLETFLARWPQVAVDEKSVIHQDALNIRTVDHLTLFVG